jgi:hypothetical protein
MSHPATNTIWRQGERLIQVLGAPDNGRVPIQTVNADGLPLSRRVAHAAVSAFGSHYLPVTQ